MDVNAGRRRDVKTRSGKNNTRYSVLTAVLVPLHTYNKHASCAHAHDNKKKKERQSGTHGRSERKEEEEQKEEKEGEKQKDNEKKRRGRNCRDARRISSRRVFTRLL